jgi:hypothetical protein
MSTKQQKEIHVRQDNGVCNKKRRLAKKNSG